MWSCLATDPETKSLCHRLCIDYEKLSEWLSEMASLGLLTVHDDVDERGERVEVYGSTRASANIERYEARKETARENGKKGGRKPKRSRAKTKSEPNGNQAGTKSKADGNPTPTQPETKEREKEYLKIFLITPLTPPSMLSDDDAEFAAEALGIFNAITGSGVLALDPRSWDRLAVIRASGRTLDDVRGGRPLEARGVARRRQDAPIHPPLDAVRRQVRGVPRGGFEGGGDFAEYD